LAEIMGIAEGLFQADAVRDGFMEKDIGAWEQG
jgi:hypothetical protein